MWRWKICCDDGGANVTLFRHDQIAKGVCRTHFLPSTVVVSRMKGIVM